METIQHSVPYIGEGLTKTQIEQLAELSVQNVLEEGNVFIVAEALSCMEKFVEAVKKDARFVEYLRDELAKNSGKITTSSGAKLEAAETGTKYDYTKTGDEEYMDLVEKKMEIDSKIKAREAFLKTVPSEGLEMRYQDQLIVVYPPNKTSTSSYKITLAK